MGKIWLKTVDQNHECCGCEGKTSPCDSCGTCEYGISTTDQATAEAILANDVFGCRVFALGPELFPAEGGKVNSLSIQSNRISYGMDTAILGFFNFVNTSFVMRVAAGTTVTFVGTANNDPDFPIARQVTVNNYETSDLIFQQSAIDTTLNTQFTFTEAASYLITYFINGGNSINSGTITATADSTIAICPIFVFWGGAENEKIACVSP